MWINEQASLLFPLLQQHNLLTAVLSLECGNESDLSTGLYRRRRQRQAQSLNHDNVRWMYSNELVLKLFILL